MVQFVKPNLLGTKKEFLNRFVNPILAGQGKDSSAFDVKLMKQRAHILHEMLDGCVQRRDYSGTLSVHDRSEKKGPYGIYCVNA